jgi:hypothetical protein
MRKLTKKGEDFIKSVCGTGDDKIKGRYKYDLPFSNLTPTGFTANAVDHNSRPINNNEQLADALIFWYNKYANNNDIDANTLAAIGFVDSGYVLWHYDMFTSGCGIANFKSKRVFSNIVAQPTTLESLQTERLIRSEINIITSDMIEPDQRSSYYYGGRSVTEASLEIAINNRDILYQNIIDNPELMIKAQAALYKEVLIRNEGLRANSLFAYSRDVLLEETNYRLMLDTAGRKYNDDYVREGIIFVKRVFGVLGDENNDKQPKVKYKKPKGKYFGFDIDFEINSFKSFLG